MFYNRDLSWLGFNYRVLLEADDENVPLYERIKFLSIFSSNLDEFFRVRYPQIIALAQLSKKTKNKADILETEDLPGKVHEEISRQLKEYGKILTEKILPLLKNNKVILYYNSPVLKEHEAEIREIFLSEILSFIQPVFIEADTIQKFIPENNKLYLIVQLKQKNKDVLKHAVVNIPSEKLDRFFVLSQVDDDNYVIFLDDIIRENLHRLFPGSEIHTCYSIKFNRNAELYLDNEYSGSILEKIEKQLSKREMGAPSRFLYEEGMPKNLQLFLASVFDLEYDELYVGSRYHNLKDFFSFPVFDKTQLYQQQIPITLPEIADSSDVFKLLNKKDILLHVPYHSYNPVLAFFNQAAVDPDVSKIFITLYRVAADSHIVNALISAAKNGKDVTAFIEIKARFDEENNIRWSKLMKSAGVKIIYSIPEIKVHSKTALVVKENGSENKVYAVLSTGNFNETTAKFYTDHVLLTSNKTIAHELLLLFDYLNTRKIDDIKDHPFKHLLVSQINMMDEFERLINTEIEKASNNKPALIRIKLNNLEEQQMINLLYKASAAGVKVRLLVRSICCLVPQVENESENISVRRLVDKYLEHSRLFIFGEDEDTKILTGSADWMNRNLHHRIEVCVFVNNELHKQQLVHYFDLQWNDTDKLVELDAFSNQHLLRTSTIEKKNNAQQNIYEYLQQMV